MNGKMSYILFSNELIQYMDIQNLENTKTHDNSLQVTCRHQLFYNYMVVLLELIIRWEEWMEDAFRRKPNVRCCPQLLKQDEKPDGTLSGSTVEDLQSGCLSGHSSPSELQDHTEQSGKLLMPCTSYLDTSQGSITPGWVTWARVCDGERSDPNQGYITDVLSCMVEMGNKWT